MPVAENRSTRNDILAAALRILARNGYPGLTARGIAAEAGTNIALVNYYFGSKQNLLLEVFDELDRLKVQRQQDMYRDPDMPISAKWRRAVAFYRQDLADGYVRTLQELTAHGYGNKAIAARVRQRMSEWHKLIRDVAELYLPQMGISLSPDLVATVIVSFWFGMETQHLVGITEDEVQFFEILDFVGDWLEQRERQFGIGAGPVSNET